MLEKMILEQSVAAVGQVVEKGHRFVVLAHKNPDGDAVGSTLAMCHYLRSLGKDAVVVLPNAFPAFLSWMPGADGVLFYETDKERCEEAVMAADAFFCLDFNVLSRTGDISSLLASSKATRCSSTIIYSPRTSLM